MAEVTKLYESAVRFEGTRLMNRGSVLYRNKHEGYLDDILQNKGGIMSRTVKDNSGDPDCPINGRLKGLFFCANVAFNTEDPPKISPFGPERFSVPPTALYNPATWKFYFADFYCLAGPSKDHYIILVLCEVGTPANYFCEENLITLPNDNPFFKVNGDGTFRVSPKTWVEIFYTKDINLKEMLDLGVGKRSVTLSNNSIPKDPDCSICNVPM